MELFNKKLVLITIVVLLLIATAAFLLIWNDAPYKIYMDAVDKMSELQSFRTEYIQTNTTYKAADMSDKEMQNSFIAVEYLVTAGNAEAVVRMGMDDAADVLTQYFRNGYIYEKGATYRMPQTETSNALEMALLQLFPFPASVIAEQNTIDIADGKQLSFTLDGDKYYNYINSKYNYTGEPSYTHSPAPQLTVITDKNGYLCSISGTINRQSLVTDSPHQIIDFSIEYKDINSLQILDFSDLDESKYKDPAQ